MKLQNTSLIMAEIMSKFFVISLDFVLMGLSKLPVAGKDFSMFTAVPLVQ